MTGLVPNMEPAEYYGDLTRISHSMLERFRKDTADYHKKFVLGDGDPWKPTADMVFGSAFHTLLLEPDEFEKRFEVIGSTGRRKSSADPNADGKGVVTTDGFARLQAMVAATVAHPAVAAHLVADGYNEPVCHWKDEATGINMKCRLDRLVIEGEKAAVLDFKTATNAAPSEFARSVATYGYHRQESMYCDGVLAVCGVMPSYLIVAVEKEEPFRVGVYRLDQETKALGYKQNARDLRRLADCIAYDSWVETWCVGVNDLAIPRWAHYE